MKKFGPKWWAKHDMKFIKKMVPGESSYTSFGGEYRVIQKGDKKFVEVFGPDNSYILK